MITADTQRSRQRGEVMDRDFGKLLADPEWKNVEKALTTHGLKLGAPRYPYVGPNYDLAIDGRPLRLLVVGLDWFEERTVDRASHGKWILAQDNEPKGSHWLATTNVVWAALSDSGPPDGWPRMIEVNGRQVNASSCFAFTNLFVRSRGIGVGANSKRWTNGTLGMATRALLETIRMLEPTLIVCQTTQASRVLGAHLEPVDGTHYRLNGADCLLYGHPSSRQRGKSWRTWDSTYFQERVLPDIRQFTRDG